MLAASAAGRGDAALRPCLPALVVVSPGALLDSLIRRTVPAMAATLVLFAAARVAFRQQRAGQQRAADFWPPGARLGNPAG